MIIYELWYFVVSFSFSFLHFSALAWRINWVLIFKSAILNTTTIFSQVFVFCISTTTIMGTTICKCFEISLLKEKYLRIFLQLAFLHFTIWMSLLFSFVRNIQNLVTRNIWVLSATVAKVIPYFDSHRSGRDSLSRCSAQENCRKLQHSFVIQWDAWLVNNLPIGVQLSSVLKHYLCYKVTENMFSFA